ncbi:hypothetical protein AALO_G00139990 [Alosa alosa]|uniref:Uncharacterized protein n=2 Tax=Alosa alosa TaxID=278164 RepID=A0AAV6GM36_9TELE|nr:hypothetical protein AALO_G00139990 [Alosa alosa]
MLFYLAAMHFNENAESPQQKTAKEKLCTDLPNNLSSKTLFLIGMPSSGFLCPRTCVLSLTDLPWRMLLLNMCHGSVEKGSESNVLP